MEDLRYPIGKFEPQPFSIEQLKRWADDIRYLPDLLENAILNLDEAQLQTPYRDGGWTIQQVVHHVPDSHMTAYIRFKLALTEDNPTIKPYDEAAWALLPDVENIPINISITLLHALHNRWHNLVINIKDEDWNRTVFHPEHNKEISLWNLLGMYAWHGKHHVMHVVRLRERMNW
ncbi:YfiT family bacillithiol transferase [Pinibacter aurantiacus]|uniref:Metal-dependent hydrolase n=1 Tax=Pinibacter aurantiacus TaxID=2851599 RepID=A0A9E2W8N0_9BACT|nr:putative metal-dependent hydrolase [Pinibacter aurantiacus]MBV4358412.1 putative metal-dependent hydrolase [Pinibacter aurantiacus]